MAFREEIIKAGLGGGHWTQEMDEGLERAHADIASVMKEVFERREETQKLARVARFVARYRTVLNLPETLRSLISAPSGYAQAAREYRKAQRVLRGAAGPVFREVLAELESVAARWKSFLFGRLASEFVGTSSSAEHIVEAVRALRELGSNPEPGVFFSQQQMMYALNRVNQSGSASGSEVLHEVSKLLPSLRLAYGKMGAGASDSALHAGVWGSCLEQCCEVVKLAVKDGVAAGELLADAQRFQEQVGECLHGSANAKERQPCYLAVSGLIEWLQNKTANHIRQECLRECGSNPDPLPAVIRAVDRFAPVIGESGAVEAGLSCLCKSLDLIVSNCDAAVASPFASSWSESMPPEKGSPEDALLDCASSARRLLTNGVAAVTHSSSGQVATNSRGVFESLCVSAKDRALRGYVARMAFFVRRIVGSGIQEESREEFQNKLDGKGALEETVFAPANQYSSAAPVAQVEKVYLSDWALEVVHLLIMVRSHVDGRLPEDSVFVMKSLAVLAVSIVEDVLLGERDVIGKNLSMRLAVSVRFLADVLGFAEDVPLVANMIISRTLNVKMPGSLDKAALLMRCFATDESTTARSEGKRVSVVTSSVALSSTSTRGYLPSSAASASKRSNSPVMSEAPKKELFDGKELARPSPALAKKGDMEKIPSSAKKEDDANPFGPSKTASKPSGIDDASKKKEDANPFGGAKPESAKKTDGTNPFGGKKEDANPFGAKKEQNDFKKPEDVNPFARAEKNPFAGVQQEKPGLFNSAPVISKAKTSTTISKDPTNPF